jgi:hypothetical protein
MASETAQYCGVGNHFSYSRTRKETQHESKEIVSAEKKENIGGSPMA